MIQDYISRYLNKARYELIDNGTRFYAEVKELNKKFKLPIEIQQQKNS